MTPHQISAIAIPDVPVKADPYLDSKSLEFGFRAKRFRQIRQLIEAVLAEKGTCEILDLGGTEKYWNIGTAFLEANRGRIRITAVNTEEQTVERPDMFEFHLGSATQPDLFSGRTFDLVHSNSVIEHVGGWADMGQFALNARRLAPRYYIQTPNYWFPYEPHFRFPGFQYLPERARAALIMRFSLGFFRRVENAAEAREIIHHHRLLSARQMRRLFPDGSVEFEKVAGFNKSIIAIRNI